VQETLDYDQLERPSWVTERTWRRFLAVERQGRTLVQVAREEGVSKSAVAQSVIKARAACRAVLLRDPVVESVSAWQDA
jgi:hypothetical protein